MPTAQPTQIKDEISSERGSRQTQEPTPPPQPTDVREPIEELYGVTPDRAIPTADHPVAAGDERDLDRPAAPVAVGNANAEAMDLDGDFDYQMRRAEIARTRRLQEAAAEEEYQLQVARIQAMRRVRGDRG